MLESTLIDKQLIALPVGSGGREFKQGDSSSLRLIARRRKLRFSKAGTSSLRIIKTQTLCRKIPVSHTHSSAAIRLPTMLCMSTSSVVNFSVGSMGPATPAPILSINHRSGI